MICVTPDPLQVSLDNGRAHGIPLYLHALMKKQTLILYASLLLVCSCSPVETVTPEEFCREAFELRSMLEPGAPQVFYFGSGEEGDYFGVMGIPCNKRFVVTGSVVPSEQRRPFVSWRSQHGMQMPLPLSFLTPPPKPEPLTLPHWH